VSWYHYRDFVEEFAELTPVADRLYVIDGDRITCSGGAGVADLAANLVGRHVGAAPARKAMHILNIERPRSEEASQPAPPLAMASEDWRVSRALLLMEQNLSEPLSIREIAGALDLGVRQLERHFHASLGVGPQESYMALRLKHARWMLENTALSAARIASELGFSDSSHFCRSFKARYGRPRATSAKAPAPGNGPPVQARRLPRGRQRGPAGVRIGFGPSAPSPGRNAEPAQADPGTGFSRERRKHPLSRVGEGQG
jgi:transcriptional regulator GlxA family with amidase domain